MPSLLLPLQFLWESTIGKMWSMENTIRQTNQSGESAMACSQNGTLESVNFVSLPPLGFEIVCCASYFLIFTFCLNLLLFKLS